MPGFDDFVGSRELIGRLKREIAGSMLPHALIIEGGEGSGKKTLAGLISAAVACREDAERPCLSCINCQKILRGQSPDVKLITPEKDRVQLSVDVIRRMREDTCYAPVDLDARFYIITPADAMNVQAQNALLKILEEPPPGVYFLLLCRSAGALLPTIRSRAPTCRLEVLDDEEVAGWLLTHDNAARAMNARDPEAFRAAVRLSGGSIGRARHLVSPSESGPALARRKKAEEFLRLLADRRSFRGEMKFYQFASTLTSGTKSGSAREELGRLLDLIAEAVRDLIAVRLSTDCRLLFFTDRSKAEEMADHFDSRRLMQLEDELLSLRAELEHNVSLNLAQTRLALRALNPTAAPIQLP